MIIIVDAYNVLKQIKQDIIHQVERQFFIKKIKHYAREKKHSIVVVFDGGACVWPMIEKDQKITIVYSGERLSADDYIRRYMKEHSNKELLLVTNDNELKRNARRYEVDTLGSMDFYTRINPNEKIHAKEDDNQLIKISSNAPQELDDLMEAIGSVPKKRENDDRNSRTSSGFTASKKERKISKKIKKL